MSKAHILLDMNEASDVIIKFIDSEKLDEVIKCIDDNARSGFIVGLSYALCFVMAKCKTYKCYFDDDLNK